MNIPSLSSADQELQTQLLSQKRISAQQINELMLTRERAWQDASEEFQGILCTLEPGQLTLSDFPSGRVYTILPLQSHPNRTTGKDLVYFNPDDGRYLKSNPIPSQPALLVTADGNFYFSEHPETLACLGETESLHGAGAFNHDLYVSPNGDVLFVTERYQGCIHVISLVTHKVLSTLELRPPGSSHAINMSMSPQTNQAYLSDHVSSKLWILDLGTWRLMALQTGLGVLGNLCLAPNPHFLFLSVLEPDFRLVYFDLQSLSVIQELEIQGGAASILDDFPIDLMSLDPAGKRLLYVSSDESEGESSLLVNVIGTSKVKTIRRYALDYKLQPIALMPGYANPFREIAHKHLRDWLLELKYLKPEDFDRFEPAPTAPAAPLESEVVVHFEPPVQGENPTDLLKRPAPAITLPPEADDVLVEMLVKLMFQETQKNLHQHPEEIQKLFQKAIDWRQTLEQRYMVEISVPHVLGQYHLKTFISREVLLQAVDQALEGRELPFRPHHRCPICAESLRSARLCEACGFHLEDSTANQKRELLSAESSQELIPGQVILALPQVAQVVVLNAWHEAVHAYDLKALGLNEPCYALALPNRHYLICDRQSQQAVELSISGQIVRQIQYGFQEPVMATFYYRNSKELRYLIVDRKANQILEFSSEGQLTCSWGPAQGLHLKEPREVQRTWDDTLLITDTGNKRVIEIERSGRIIASWGQPNIKLMKPVFARREINGDTLIVDAQRRQIVAFDKQQQLTRNFLYWPPTELTGIQENEPAPEHFVVYQRELIAMSSDYWMQISVLLQQIRWVKPWTGEYRRQRTVQMAQTQTGSSTLHLLRNISFLKQASDEVLALIEKCLTPLNCKAGDTLVHQGELGSSMYFLLEGQVEILKERTKQAVATLGPGNIFGEMALILSEPRIASVRATRDCRLLQLDRLDFNEVLQDYPELSEQLKKMARERKALLHGYSHQKQQEVRNQVKTRMAIAKLKEHPYFADADAKMLEMLANALRPVAFMPKHTIFTQGESGETMYFITRGKVEVYLTGSDEPVATLQAGDVFGEMALLLDQARSATVRTDNYCQCFELDRATFEHIAGQYPGLQERLQEIASQRLELNQDFVAQQQAQAEDSAALEAAHEQAAAAIEDALVGAEVIGSAPRMMCYVVSTRQNQVMAIDGEGQFLWRSDESFGLFHPSRFHADQDTLWITDTGHDRILAVNTDTHQIMCEWGDHLLTLSQPRSAVPTSKGHLLIADEGNQRLVLANSLGSFMWEYTTPNEIMSPMYAEETPRKTFLFCDAALHMVYEIDPNSKQILWSYGSLLIAGNGPNELCEPSCVRRLSNGSTLIADTGNSRLLLISPQGQLLRSYRGSKEMPLHRPVHCEMTETGEVLVWSGLQDEIIRLDLAGDPVWKAKIKSPAHHLEFEEVFA